MKYVRLAIVVFILWPYACSLAPCGGAREQVWLDAVIAHLEQVECDDPGMKHVIDYTIRRYNRIGRFRVAVLQLPEGTDGLNYVWVPGVCIDVSVLDKSTTYGAAILVHEAMHDYPPHFGHWHIDDGRIWEAVI